MHVMFADYVCRFGVPVCPHAGGVGLCEVSAFGNFDIFRQLIECSC